MNETIGNLTEMVGNVTENLANTKPGTGFIYLSPSPGDMFTVLLIMAGIAIIGFAFYYLKGKKGSK